MAAGPGFGSVQASVDGQPASASVDLYAAQMTPREISLGTVALKAGPVPVAFVVTGKNPDSKGLDIGIDAFILKPAN
jgi:hypothetical protein